MIDLLARYKYKIKNIPLIDIYNKLTNKQYINKNNLLLLSINNDKFLLKCIVNYYQKDKEKMKCKCHDVYNFYNIPRSNIGSYSCEDCHKYMIQECFKNNIKLK